MILKSILNDWKELKKERKKIKINSGAAQAHFDGFQNATVKKKWLLPHKVYAKFMRYEKETHFPYRIMRYGKFFF